MPAGMLQMRGPARIMSERIPEPHRARGNVARNAFHLLLGQGGTTVLAVLLSAGLGRWLGAADFGLFFLLSSMATFAFVVADWGQQQFVVREVARDRSSADGMLGTSTVLRVATSAVLAILMAASAYLLGYDARTCGLAVLLMLTMLPFFLAQAFGQVFRGLERMDLDAAVGVMNKVLVLALTVAALVAGSGIVGAIIAQGIAGAGALLFAAHLMRHRLGVRFGRPTREVAMSLMRGGAPLMLMSFAIASHSYVDAVVLSRLGTAEEVGWFGAARNIFGTIIAPAAILATASFPVFSRLAGDVPRLRQALLASLRPLLGLGALGGVGTYLFAGFAVKVIYGEGHFARSTEVLQAFAPGLFVLFMDVLLGCAVIAIGRSRTFALAKVANVVVATVLGVLLVPVFQRSHGNGGVGIAAAFGASEVIMFVSAAVLLPRGTLHVSMLLDAARALAAGAATLLLFHLLPQVHPLLGIPLCIAVYAAFAAALGLVRSEEVALVRTMLRRDPPQAPAPEL
jgi:PST family polysaccharide transporter